VTANGLLCDGLMLLRWTTTRARAGPAASGAGRPGAAMSKVAPTGTLRISVPRGRSDCARHEFASDDERQRRAYPRPSGASSLVGSVKSVDGVRSDGKRPPASRSLRSRAQPTKNPDRSTGGSGPSSVRAPSTTTDLHTTLKASANDLRISTDIDGSAAVSPEHSLSTGVAPRPIRSHYPALTPEPAGLSSPRPRSPESDIELAYSKPIEAARPTKNRHDLASRKRRSASQSKTLSRSRTVSGTQSAPPNVSPAVPTNVRGRRSRDLQHGHQCHRRWRTRLPPSRVQ
jgi:hypothetical protein